ncbi:hypothetical protein CDD80_5548 [Ophiocordyceps camponoti-rufipedis]|uniref:Extracellular membrane protein CFEM domain-containing protein n=1 Tax=Ophiocordyceps camponoti-rufipedis TaxID=2004952 RepID=A0A2C5YTV7_9HYPO|nr:hypothetical protein CDD80_5548 [Ophiocordyceps camponoti-rufipedis]
MRFQSVIAGSVFALAVRAQSGTSTADMSMPPTSTMAMSPAQASEKACREQCSVNDLPCRARCEPVPAPNTDQVNATTECVAKCDQKNTDAYTMCREKCIADHYFKKGSGTPDPKHAVDSNSGDASSSNVVEKAASSSSSAAASSATDMSSGMMSTASGATTMATETSTMTDTDMSSSSSHSGSPTSSGSGSRAAASSSSSQGWAPAVTAAPAAALGLVAMALAL